MAGMRQAHHTRGRDAGFECLGLRFGANRYLSRSWRRRIDGENGRGNVGVLLSPCVNG